MTIYEKPYILGGLLVCKTSIVNTYLTISLSEKIRRPRSGKCESITQITRIICCYARISAFGAYVLSSTTGSTGDLARGVNS